jgi:hypothetical protein
MHKAEALTNAANGELQRYMTLYDASFAHTDELVKEIQKIKEENVNAMRRMRREKVEVEKRNRAAVKAIQGRAVDMDRMKDEWGVTQALNVKLYAENRRLTRELEEVRDRLLKVSIFVFVLLWAFLRELTFHRLKIRLTRRFDQSLIYGLRGVR